MPKICDLIAAKAAKNESWVSYEFYPPRTESGVANLEARLARMRDTATPLFCDMTWGAGGSTSALTLALTVTMKQLGLEANMHLTCTNVARGDVTNALDQCKSNGICNIVALRGDAPAGQDKWEATAGGFECALDLVKFIRQEHGDFFCISVAGYPEGHPDVITEVAEEALTASEKTRCRRDVNASGKERVFVCRDAAFAVEIAYLKTKVDAGADLIITQMFFDVGVYSSFVSACRNAGILVPIVPGLMLIQQHGGFKRMTAICKSRVPLAVNKRADAARDDDDALKAFGIDFGTEMCRDLLRCGAPGLHFYTLNLEKTTLAIIDRLSAAEARERRNERLKHLAAAAAAAAATFAILCKLLRR
ncbi:methylenetetrahydrofolate reductase [Pelagophyceae sp. CCMP2097]|nr:methylenetetrahydrofolate reductase [Pelagophyceae sp. CCMP2097]